MKKMNEEKKALRNSIIALIIASASFIAQLINLIITIIRR